MVLRGVISQQLVPDVNGNPIPMFEIMYMNMAIRNMIREGKTHQLDAAIASGAAQGMNTMDSALLKAYEAGRITAQTVIDNCTNYDTVSKRINIR